MTLFKPASNTQAYLKAGLMGFAGDGKTFTGTLIAIGLVKLMREMGLERGNLPAFFLDTETGSDWVKPKFDAEGIKLFTAKTRAFVDLLTAVKEAEKNGSILIIDSISHFWRDLMEGYAKKKKRTNGLQFQDWAWLKKKWGEFTDLFVNSQCHIIMCGRAGYEYDFFEQEGGKKELEKTGIKMKAETETGYEPSILVLMEKHRDIKSGEVWRTASILKDRANLIDGKTFKNPTFKDFKQHIDFLNLGGEQLGVDTSRTSDSLYTDDGKPTWIWEKEQKAIALQEIKDILEKYHPGSGAEAKSARADLVEKFVGTRTWARVESLDFNTIQNLRNRLWIELTGGEYNFSPIETEQGQGETGERKEPDTTQDKKQAQESTETPQGEAIKINHPWPKWIEKDFPGLADLPLDALLAYKEDDLPALKGKIIDSRYQVLVLYVNSLIDEKAPE